MALFVIMERPRRTMGMEKIAVPVLCQPVVALKVSKIQKKHDRTGFKSFSIGGNLVWQR